MKKILSIFVLFTMLINTLSFGGYGVAAGEGGTSGSFTWALDDDGVLTISGEGEMPNINSNSAWKNMTDAIKHVIIEDGVTSIDGDAFAFCTALKSVSIPDSVTTIGGFAFIGCSSLEKVDIPEGVTTIGDSAFRECDALKYVTIPASVTGIGIQAFNFNKSLVYIGVDDANTAYCDVDGVLFNKDATTLIQYASDRRVYYYQIPDGVTTIENYAFAFTNSVIGLTIPDSVETIGHRAFYNCSLNTVTINKGVTTIQPEAFYEAASLKTVNYHGNEEEWAVINVGENNTALDSATKVYNYNPKAVDESGTWGGLNWVLDVSGTLTISGEGPMNDFGKYTSAAWRGHSHSIYNIVIEDGVTSIGDNAFNELMLLNSITIGSGVTEIGHFFLFESLRCANITVADDNPAFCSVDGALLNKDKTTLIKYAVNNPAPSFAIPTGVTMIIDDAFTGCVRVLDVTIPNGVTYIGDSAFANCCEMESINIPEGVTYIGSNAFSNCYRITSVVIPDSVTTVGKGAFRYCYDLVDVTIGKGITTLPQEMFAVCGDLTSITIPANVTTIEENAFYDCPSLKTIYYEGTEEQWNGLTIGYNDCIINGTIIFGFVLGDVNGDNEVDNTDALLILKYDAGIIEFSDSEIKTADVNGDSYADNTDALFILKYDAGIIDSIPPSTKTNYALGKIYTLSRDLTETDPNSLYLDYANGKTQWSDLSLTKMTDGIVGDITNEEYYSFYALPNVTVQLVGTNRIFSYIIDLGENYDDISSFVFRNVRDGVTNGNNRGFRMRLAYVSDDCENWTKVTGTETNTPIAGAPVINNNYNPEIAGVEHVDVTYTLDTPAAGRYVKLYLTSDGGYVTQLEEIEIWN